VEIKLLGEMTNLPNENCDIIRTFLSGSAEGDDGLERSLGNLLHPDKHESTGLDVVLADFPAGISSRVGFNSRFLRDL
jgi:hypothetical protein